MPLKRGEAGACGGISDAGGLVPSGSDDPCAVRAEHAGIDTIVMPFELFQDHACRGIPDAGGFVPGGSQPPQRQRCSWRIIPAGGNLRRPRRLAGDAFPVYVLSPVLLATHLSSCRG
jgi:hypothetical protein